MPKSSIEMCTPTAASAAKKVIVATESCMATDSVISQVSSLGLMRCFFSAAEMCPASSGSRNW